MTNRKEAGQGQPRIEKRVTPQQEALLVGMYHEKKDAVTAFDVDAEGNRIHSGGISIDEILELIENFRKDPKKHCAYARENILSIRKDVKLSQAQKKERIKRYVDAYFNLIPRLDRKAFPPSDKIYSAVPEYIPDGLSDMGSDDETEPIRRHREKIRVDKRKIFDQSRDLFYEVFSVDTSQVNLEQVKQYIVQRVAHFVYSNMPYDKVNADSFRNAEKSVGVHESLEKRLAVCRHHAIYTQVLLQAFGITSRLLKCDVDIEGGTSGAHVANLVRINDRWYLLDVTNPDVKQDGVGEVFLRPISENHIDLNRQTYKWNIKRNNGKNWEYKSRNNMYYRIRDNQKK